jgi:DNA-binding CsgD family transcriptional regulator
MKEGEFDGLVEAVYDAAEDPAGLAPLLTQVGRALRAQVGHAFVIPLSCPANAENHHYGGPADAFVEYERHWREKDPRFQIAMARPNEVLADTMVLDMPAFERSEVHREVLAKYDNHYSLFGNHVAAPDLLVAAAWLRSKRDGPYEKTEVDRIRAIVTHMKRAVRLRHLVGSLRDQIADLRRALDAVPVPTAILDEKSTVVCANQSAEELFEERDGLRTEKGRLSASVLREQRALEAAIAKAMATADSCVRQGSRALFAPAVKVTRTHGTLSVVVFPLRDASIVRRQATAKARVLVVIHDPSRIVHVDRALVAELHGLTATEAELAASLAEGKTLAEFAEARGSSEQTARTHLKRILDKTETRRQADLVRVLLTGVAVHGIR